MAQPSATSHAGNARVVVSSTVGEEVAAQVDQLAAQWGLDRSNAIREILESVAEDERMQRGVKIRMLPTVLPLAQRYIVRRGGTIQHFDGSSYVQRKYAEGQVLGRGDYLPVGY